MTQQYALDLAKLHRTDLVSVFTGRASLSTSERKNLEKLWELEKVKALRR